MHERADSRRGSLGPPGRLATHGVTGSGVLWSLVAYLSHWLLRSCPCSCVAPGPLWAPSFPPDLTPSLPFLRMHPCPRSLHISPTPSCSPGSPFQSLRLGCFAFTSFQSLCQRPSPWPAFKIQKPGIQLPPYLCSAASSFPPGSECCLIWLLLG